MSVIKGSGVPPGLGVKRERKCIELKLKDKERGGLI